MGQKHKKFVRVSFHVCIRDVQIGEHVRVCGSDDALGNWNAEHGMSLWAFEETDCWVSEEVQLPMKELVEYKYAVCENGTGKVRYWEDKEDNRVLVPSGVCHTVEDDDGLYRKLAKEGDFPVQDQRRQSTENVSAEKLQTLSELRKFKPADFRGTVYIVSVTLPYQAVKAEDGSYHAVESYGQCGMTIALLHQGRKELVSNRLRFVGWPQCYTPENDEDRKKIEKCLLEEDCIPVFLEEGAFQKFNRFCKEYMWPAFHNVSVFSPQSQACRGSKVSGFPIADWDAYKNANALYAAVVVGKCHPGDIIFAQDYHLILVPKYTNTARPEGVKAGLYLHTPWPGSSVFLSLPVRDEMLKGVLGSDYVGFQFFEYTRNFLTACSRLLKLQPVFRMGGVMALEYNNRSVTLRSQHVVIPYEQVLNVIKAEVRHPPEEIRDFVGSKIIFASIDHCERFAGIGLKLKAFRLLLETYPQHINRCMLVQYCLTPRSAFEDNIALQGELEVEVEDINKQFGYHVFFKVHDFDHIERFSLLKAAPIFLNTSIKEGLNIGPFEFLASHAEDKQGIVIVSEFAGCSRALMGALRVNPWSISAVCNSLDTAMTMQLSERKDRFAIDHSYVSKQSLTHWLEETCLDIRSSCISEGREGYLPVPHGFAEGFSLVEWHLCTLLDPDLMIQRYRSAKNRVIFFDHDGTLVAKTHGTGQGPPLRILSSLATLCKDPMTNIVVVSGRGKDVLEHWYGQVEGLWLCAEHGYYMAQMPLTSDGWECIVDESLKGNEGWQRLATALMEHYVKRTQGSTIEEKGSCVTWNYFGAELALGTIQAKYLTETLSSLLQSYQCEVASGMGYVEVKVRGVNKGVAVNMLLEKFGEVDFVLCVGDDRSDEEMFVVINQKFDPVIKSVAPPKKRLSEGLRSLQRGWVTPDPSPTHSVLSADLHSPRSSGNIDSPRAQSRSVSPIMRAVSPQGADEASLHFTTENVQKMGVVNKGALLERAQHTDSVAGLSMTGKSLSARGVESCSPRRGTRDQGPSVFTVTIGLKPTSARNYLNDVTSLQNLVRQIDSKGIARMSRISSVPVMASIPTD
eukprot:GEMP01005371.1.p1 GENE.GEMP01005371.1~~GEMP01005371.1.p1  ORF type:complete len:1078 (+),score=211.66 GEMP01005371.1:44-3277(+)